jgi:hypothetical protein
LNSWSTFAEICGTASASLIGLLFVAVSIRIDLIAPSQELRNRAAQTLSLFGTVLIVAILTAVPGQPTRALGAELTALAIITAGGLIVLDRRARAHASSQAIARALELLTPTTIVSITLFASGALLASPRSPRSRTHETRNTPKREGLVAISSTPSDSFARPAANLLVQVASAASGA